MPRYIDADLIPYVESENGVLDDYAYRYDINEIPEADVVPRSEVASIFEEIENLMLYCACDYGHLHKKIQEFKKKKYPSYTKRGVKTNERCKSVF